MKDLEIRCDYLLKNGVCRQEVYRAIAARAKEETLKMFSEIIWMAYDLEKSVGLSPKEAFKEALAANGIILSDKAAETYAKAYSMDKVDALNKVIREVVEVYPYLFSTADKSFCLSFFTKYGKDFVRLESKQDVYFTDDRFLALVMYETDYTLSDVVDEVLLDSCNPEAVSTDDLIAFMKDNGAKYSDCNRRACMLLTNSDFKNKAEALNGWQWANLQNNLESWLDCREREAAKLLDVASWSDVLGIIIA